MYKKSVNVPKSAWMAFVLHLFPHWNSLSTGTRDYLFQLLH